MTHQPPRRGVYSPAVTPIAEDLAPDLPRFVSHCRHLLDDGCDGLAVFGTTSEANSFSVDERTAALEALVAGGIDPSRLMPGTGCCAITDTVHLTRHALSLGCSDVLMLPPFYYKGVSDDGLYRGFAEVIDRVGDARLKVYLYHIPPVAQVPFSVDLVKRLAADYPGTVVGLKDSSGEWPYTETLLRELPGFGVFSGSEVFLLANLRANGAGTISATANVNAPAMRHVLENWQTAEADALQEALTRRRKIVQNYPVIPALKAVLGHYGGDAGWRTVRPPLVALDDADTAALVAALEADGFSAGVIASEAA